MWGHNNAAALPEYATAQIAVWWDMNDCTIPEGYDARQVRPSIEGAFKKLGYSGPVSITAYGNLTQTSDHLLRGLSSTGVAVAHTVPKNTCSEMFSDLLKWRGHNPPPATMMLISDHVEDVFSFDLARLQQETNYNLFRASSFKSRYMSVLRTSADWVWDSLLGSKDQTTSVLGLSAMFYCKSCSFDCQSLASFTKHLSSRKHQLEEVGNPGNGQLDPVTRMWGRNYAAKPEYATAQIAVWWDMEDCPIPEGYDARRVRPSIEGAFKKLGYSGPVSITAYDDLTQTPDHLLRGLSSTGVAVAHTIPERTNSIMFSDLFQWQFLNPPPATMMLIADHVEDRFAKLLAMLQQMTKYNIFLAYSFKPCKMPVLVTSAEWLWDSLLAVSETRRPLLKLSTVSETTRPFLQQCSGESTGMFYCKLCDNHYDFKSLDNFRKHLSSKEHGREEYIIHEGIKVFDYERQQWVEADTPRSKRLRKAFRTGFRLLRSHLVLTNRGERRRRARKSQMYKKELWK